MTFRDRVLNWLDLPNSAAEVSGIGDGLPYLNLAAIPSSIYTGATRGELYSIAYLACEQTKARSLASLPVGVFRRVDGHREEVDHPLAQLLAYQANDLMSGRDLRNWLSLRRDTFGTAYIYVEWKRGQIVGLWPVMQHVDVLFDRNAREGYRVKYRINESTDTVPAGVYFADEILPIKTTVTKDGVEGQSLARLAARNIDMSVDLELFYESMMRNGNHQLGHVEMPAGVTRMSQDDLDSLRRAVDEKSGITNAGRAPIFANGAKWVQDDQTIADMNLIEQQAWVLEQVCRACNVPPWMVYNSRNGGGKYENAEAARVDYVTNTMVPDVTALETVFNCLLIRTGHPELYVKFNLNGLMRGDKTAQGQYYREMIYSGAMTREEIRDLEDLDPIKGLEKPLVPMNYALIEPDGSTIMLTTNAAAPADGMQTGATD